MASVDRTFAEPVRLLPLEHGEVDPDRKSANFNAVLRTGEGAQSRLSGGRGERYLTKLAAGKVELFIDKIAYDHIVVRNGDMIVATARKGEPMFEVLRVDDRGQTRLVLELGEA